MIIRQMQSGYGISSNARASFLFKEKDSDYWRLSGWPNQDWPETHKGIYTSFRLELIF